MGDDSLSPLLGGVTLTSSHTENGVCYVEVSGLGAETDGARRAAESLMRSLLTLDGVDEVQLLADGEPFPPMSSKEENKP